MSICQRRQWRTQRLVVRHFRCGGKFDLEDRATLGRARNVHLSAMFAHDAQHDGQPQSGPNTRGFGGEKGIEDPRQNDLRYSWPVIGDFQQHPALSDSFGAEPDGAALAVLFDGLLGVTHQIHQHLLQMPRIALDEWKYWVQINLHADFLGGEAEAL